MNISKKNTIFLIGGLVAVLLFAVFAYIYFSKGGVQYGPESVNTPVQTPEIEKTPKPPPPLPKYIGEAVEVIKEDASVTKLYPEETKNAYRAELLDLSQKLAAKPDSLDDWLRVGVLKKFFGDFNGARDAWEYAGLIRPMNSTSFFNLGGLYTLYLKDYPNAETNYNKAINNSPLEAMLYIGLADLYRYSLIEKVSQIPVVIGKGLSANPGDLGLLLYSAGYWRDTKEYTKAIDAYEKVLIQDPGNTAVKQEIEKLKKEAATSAVSH